MIPYARQNIDDNDVDAVVAALRSAWLTQGPQIPAFEQAVATRCQCAHTVAVSSATAALHLACLALDIGPGDQVWTSPNTFVASANCARYCGAEVDFVDIDPDTLNMSVAALAAKLEAASKTGRLPKAIIPVHFSGRSCAMREIAAMARPHGIRIIEDASHAIGASYAGRPVGCCEYSDITIFSFHPVKIITSGEGGMALTNNSELAARLSRLRTHGITRDTQAILAAGEGDWYYEQSDLGFNYRMTDIHAALGLSQLSRLDAFLERRILLAERYAKHLSSLPTILPSLDTTSAWHLYVVQLPGPSDCRKRVFQQMREAGIIVNVHYIPVHLQPYYRQLGFKAGDFPNAEAYYHRALTLPLHPGLSEADQDTVTKALKDILTTEGY
jgi:UDP-4-amino-4,6-dideoxy-N-acetyl-beta-L-altrosamine transaminase